MDQNVDWLRNKICKSQYSLNKNIEDDAWKLLEKIF